MTQSSKPARHTQKLFVAVLRSLAEAGGSLPSHKVAALHMHSTDNIRLGTLTRNKLTRWEPLAAGLSPQMQILHITDKGRKFLEQRDVGERQDGGNDGR